MRTNRFMYASCFFVLSILSFEDFLHGKELSSLSKEERHFKSEITIESSSEKGNRLLELLLDKVEKEEADPSLKIFRELVDILPNCTIRNSSAFIDLMKKFLTLLWENEKRDALVPCLNRLKNIVDSSQIKLSLMAHEANLVASVSMIQAFSKLRDLQEIVPLSEWNE
ncbi:hypothetical protein, partial [Candidatus Similichlamydia epinepheli]|uniref:hypothetical protein n=1 Tax=Candidatus Similichlamydia epinepheli TaxID=1903953 RepID=UPI001300A76B